MTTSEGPAATASRAVGSPGSAHGARSSISPLPKSWISGTPAASANSANSRAGTAATNPSTVKLLRCTLTIAPVRDVQARR